MDKSEFLNLFNDSDEKISMLADVDFKVLIDSEDYNYDSDKSIINFLNYKFLGKYDCDKIFGEMFGYEHTDTMNSFWTIFKKYIKMCLPNELNLENGEIKQEDIDKYKSQYNYELTTQQLWVKHIIEMSKSDNVEFNAEISDFSRYTHTIGNFIEVPSGFNASRYSNTFDYWDLTLLCIYKWYQTQSDFWLEILLNNDKNAIDNTKDWLSSYYYENKYNYTPWQVYVITEDLQSFVDENYKPIEFFNNHFDNFEKLITNKENLLNYNEKEKLLNPQNKEDLIQCVHNINNCILNRGMQIVENELENLENNDSNNASDEKIIYDDLIVTNQTNVDFPVVADIINIDTFHEKAQEGMTINGSLYFDINCLDKETYEALKETEIKISFFRITPTYVTEKILDWKV